MACGLAMSGIETSKEPKEGQVHICASCMNTVIQTFGHLQEQIRTLKNENVNLQKEIRALEKKLAMQKKKS